MAVDLNFGNVVGNTEYCKFPKESLAVEKVGGYFNPSLEKILSLNPSIVIMQRNNYKLGQKLNVPKNPQTVGALGAALIAKR